MMGPRLDEPGLTYFSGIESTYMPHADVDVLETTRHVQQVEADLQLARGLGLRYLRYSAPWHRIEGTRGTWDWQWMDRAMGALQAAGIEPIIDLLHHTSFPRWLEGGFAHPEFPAALARFSQAFAERYPWVTWYTVFNEPYITCILCGDSGIWYPFHEGGDRTFIPMLVNACQALCTATEAIIAVAPHARFFHIDTCEYHHALDPAQVSRSSFLNLRRFVAHDLVRGRVDARHVLWPYLRDHGLTDKQAQWLQEHPARVDLLGLDYYAHSELGHSTTHGVRQPAPVPLGFAAVARDYQQRYATPALLGETNVRGTVMDRLTWLRHMLEQAERCAKEGRPLLGFGWYPLIDSCDWDSLLRNPRGRVDPQGIFWLSKGRRVRHPSVFSDWYGRLARDEAHWSEIPATPFSRGCLRWVRQHRDCLMADWPWLERRRFGP